MIEKEIYLYFLY